MGPKFVSIRMKDILNISMANAELLCYADDTVLYLVVSCSKYK